MKLIGYGLCLNGARATQSTAALATSQVLLGMGSFQVVGARVGAQVRTQPLVTQPLNWLPAGHTLEIDYADIPSTGVRST